MNNATRELLEVAASRYEEDLPNPQWFEERGISHSGLGMVKRPINGHEPYEGMLSIPYVSPSGELVGMRFRCMRNHDCEEAGHTRYSTPTGTRLRLYNTAAIIEHASANTILLTNDELVAIMLSNVCGTNSIGAVAAPDGHWETYYPRVFEDFERVIVVTNSSKEGRVFAHIASEAIQAAVPVVTHGDLLDTYKTDGKHAVCNTFKELVL